MSLGYEENLTIEEDAVNQNYTSQSIDDSCGKHHEQLQDLWGDGFFICESCLIEHCGDQND